ncbi:MAG: lipocalin family protein [Candidatus Babeliales bacterium]
MKIVFMLLIALFTSASTLPPVSHVDPQKFSGLWFEVARTYNDFEKNCVAATVEYTLTKDKQYEVTNRCFDRVIGGDLITYKGTAAALLSNNVSKLKMTYFWVFSRDYYVVYLDESYSHAVIVDPDMKQVWIMSRTPILSKPKLDRVLTLLTNAMDTKRLIFTPQDKQGRYQ